MLGSLVVAAVPLVATLAVAFYVLRKIQQCASCEPEREQQSDLGVCSGGAGRGNTCISTRNRRPRRHQNTTNTSRHLTHKNESGSPINIQEFDDIDKECGICFEQVNCVQLYPCCHSRICESCVNKIITERDRLCPFCRRYIEAYRC